MGYDSLNTLIVCGNSTDRFRFKQTAILVPSLKKIANATSIQEAKSILDSKETLYDIIFIGHDFGKEVSEALVTYAKESKAGIDAGYIFLLPANDKNGTQTASSIFRGADACLQAPFSVEDVAKVSDDAAEIRKKRTYAREAAALKVFVHELISNIDKVWLARITKGDRGDAMRRLKEIRESTRGFTGQRLNVFHALIMESVLNIPAPRIPGVRSAYRGASKRIKQRGDQTSV